MADRNMKRRALVYFTNFGSALGGGEYLPLLFVAELQKTCDVTLALNWRSDVAAAAKALGIPIDIDRLKVEILKPANDTFRKIDSIIPFFTTRRLKTLAKHADICISAANPVDFGKPAHHFIYLLRTFGDNAFLDYISHARPKTGLMLLKRRLRTAFAEAILRPLLGVRSTRKIVGDRRERIYPTSRYVESVMAGFYGPFNSRVFYPPTTFMPGADGVARDPNRIVYVGQIFPEKKVHAIIGIVERARELTGRDLTLHVAGALRDTAYVDSVKRLAAERPWVTLAGGVYGKDKATFLAAGTYAIHAERDEAFGISITEYLKAGDIAIVPDEGGAMEVVDSADLSYGNDEEAAQILARLLSDAAFGEKARQHCAERAAMFGYKAYLDSQNRLLEEIVAL